MKIIKLEDKEYLEETTTVNVPKEILEAELDTLSSEIVILEEQKKVLEEKLKLFE